MAPAPRISADRAAMTALLLLVVIALGGVCVNQFLTWDDNRYVAGNPAILWPTFASLVSIWKNPEAGLYIPLPYTVWWAIAHVAQVTVDGTMALRPFPFHLANLLLHAVTVLLEFQLLRALRFGLVPAAFGAAVLAVHPLVVESVAWTMGLRDTLAAACCIAALLMGVRERRVWSAVFTAAAVLSKPSSVMVVPMMVAIDCLGFGRPFVASLQRRRWMISVGAAGAVLAVAYQPSLKVVNADLWQRPLVGLDALAFYIAKCFVPIGLTFDYARSPQYIFRSGEAYWTWVLPIGLATVLAISRSRRWALIALLFVLPLLPVLGLVEFGFESYSTVADRYVYLALIAPAAGVAALLEQRGTVRWRVAAALVISVLAVLSWRQARSWRDVRTFYAHGVAANPRSATSWNGLAVIATLDGDANAGCYFAQRAVAVFPDFAPAHRSLLDIYLRMKNPAAASYELGELERVSAMGPGFDPKLSKLYRARIAKLTNTPPASQP